MSLVLILISLLLPSPMRGNTGMDFKKMGYASENVFIYQLKYTDKEMIDTLALFTSSIPNWNKGQYHSNWAFMKKNKKTWEIDYSRTTSSEGIVANDSTLFIHPPRFEHLRETQFYPYPYIKSDEYNPWTWNFTIGGNWNTPPHFILNNKETFKTEYKTWRHHYSPFEDILNGWKVIASSKSRFGKTYATFYFCNKYGITTIEYTGLKNKKMTFKLIEKSKDFSLWKKNELMLSELLNHKKKLFIK